MKLNKIIFPLAAVSMVFASCDDQVMEWREPDKTVTGSDIPMELAEKISKYDFIKNYMAEYHPGVDITLGMGLDNFLDDEAYRQVVLDNFQGVTFGNAMKHQSIVSASGAFNWAKVDQFTALATGLKLHGHNLIWHTQQQQTYMKSLIAPQMIIESDPTNDISNMLSGDNSDFEGNAKGGWGSWGNESESGVTSPGHDSNYCMYLLNPTDASAWNAQCAYTFDNFLEPGTYKIRFYAKATSAAGQLQFQYQNGTTYGSQGGYNTFNIGTDWTLCEYEFELTFDDVNRILLNFGAVGATYYVDDIEFGLKQEVPADPMVNILPAEASDFNDCADGSTGGWGSWGSGKKSAATVADAGKDGSTAVVIENNGDGNAWEAQFAYTFDEPLTKGQPYIIQFEAKSSTPAGQLQFQYQNGTSYGSQGGYHTFEVGTDWMTQEYEFTIAEYDDVNRIILNFGAVGGTYTIDNIKFGPKIETPAGAPVKRASSITYKIKTPEEKKAILLEAMETWIKEAMTHLGDACTSWDVINEPIGDNGRIRGVEGGWMEGDSEPVETTDAGLNLNWANDAGNGHFYWGYYCGMDYAVKAFEYAAKYSPNGAKLFVNEYNLETSPSKLAKLVEFVNYIDNNGAHVDGIGTQMHVSSSITKDKVDAMFKTLAATGKLIRITELDVALGTASPSAEQLQTQSDVYQMILTSYFENVPESQQSAITVWTLSDNAKEHEYWLKDESPNLFDSGYGRKVAYKGVCDAIAGFDVSASFTSHDWSQSASAQK
ncbi:endo-1,4-beta-xylanase [uncultured Duncaniella sp.]|uniref:endo-1,4-beta-xylanase n=1 Tax=uncultured Duncaniella sp. TaxID=2768039 RepID=UPI00262C6B62|nr:endo-1,4-beta-xylanase [uncultured Duncaniella sp.]